jgi:hypothetical protein
VRAKRCCNSSLSCRSYMMFPLCSSTLGYGPTSATACDGITSTGMVAEMVPFQLQREKRKRPVACFR